MKRHSSRQWLSPAKINASHGCFQSTQKPHKEYVTYPYKVIAYNCGFYSMLLTSENTHLPTIQELTKQDPISLETICRRSAHSLLPVLSKKHPECGKRENLVQHGKTESNRKWLCTTLTAPVSLPKPAKFQHAKVQPSDSKVTELTVLDHVFQCFAINTYSTLVKGQVVPSTANNRQTNLCVCQDQVHGVLEIILSWSSLVPERPHMD